MISFGIHSKLPTPNGDEILSQNEKQFQFSKPSWMDDSQAGGPKNNQDKEAYWQNDIDVLKQ